MPLWCDLLWGLAQKGRFIQEMSRLGDMRTQLLFGLKEWKMKGFTGDIKKYQCRRRPRIYIRRRNLRNIHLARS